MLALAVYVATLCPTIFADDCGEIATAVATGGVMHPPGYPLYCIIGGLFVRLIPLGEPAYRLGLLSCICAAVAVSLTYQLCRRIGAGRIWSAAAALAFAFSFSLWQQATKVETYALNAAFVAGLLLLAADYERDPAPARLYRLALTGGLALTNHLTVIWLIPALLGIIARRLLKAEPIAWPKVLARAVAVTLLPLALYAYEIVAARTHPGGQIWGDTSNLHRLFLHVAGARYHSYFHLPTLSWLYQRDILFMPGFLWTNLGPLLLLAALGAWQRRGQLRRRPLARGLVIGVFGYLICNTLYRILNIFEYYTPVVLMLSVLAAAGGQRLTDRARAVFSASKAHRPIRLAQTGALALAALAPLLANWQSCNRSRADDMRTLAQNVLYSLPQNALLVGYGDNSVFPLWYAQEVLHIRRDVVVLPRDFFIQWASPEGREIDRWCIDRIAKEHPETNIPAYMARAAVDPEYARSAGALWDVVRTALTRGRSVYFTYPQPEDLIPGPAGDALARIPGATLVREGILCRVTPLDRRPNEREALRTALRLERVIRCRPASPRLYAYEPDGDLTNRIYADSLVYTGQLLTDRGDYDAAYERMSRAYQMDSRRASTADAFAYASALVGRTADAIEAWKAAERLDPGNPNYRKNIQTALGQAPRNGMPRG